MNDLATTADTLRAHLALCREVLGLVEKECAAVRDPATTSYFEFVQAKKALLPRLTESVDGLKRIRTEWQRLSEVERAAQPEVAGLLRQNQDLIMKIMVLDRENEQVLLRKGLVPARHIPPQARQKPHFVADMYRRQGGGA